ncbi:BAG domain-containing protein Samui [Anopheles moucheti]|uniref:BAG domain-containing protein Samui n=1 Tax=Anopheles moucheti TaxID=186751 RepID=UPI0022F115AB|nr:BAG domain-containing protein Samui [Anopheles moucheti]XP_052902010.1 BAG domain-containing protein Samui [Anopheles moucheti]
MSSQQEQPQQQQPTVRHIPIFVEGRSEPLINTTPESQPSQPSQHHPSAGMEAPNMEMPSRNDFFKHGPIFDRARDIPVRSNFPGFQGFDGFKREASPGASRTSPFPDISNHMWPESDPLNANVPRGTSIPRQTPSPSAAHQQQKPNTATSQQQQHVPRTSQPQPHPQTHPQPQPQQQQPQQQQPAGQDQPDSRPKMPTREDPITKIQKIQKDVLAIFDQVEHFKGGKEGKKDKAYIYLDEMLTQNLLKLDSIDAEDQPQIKSARKEAIKSINTCIAVLEAKAEAGASGSANASTGSIGNANANSSSNGIDANGTNQSASNISIPHSSSNSSQQQANEVAKQQ